MPTYYVQDFKYTNPANRKTGDATMYGEESAHDHARAVQFTVDATAWLVNKFHWPSGSIEAGKFMSKQPAPAEGHKLTWNGKNWV